MTLRPRVGPPCGLWAIDTELTIPRLGFVRVVRGSEASVRPSGKTPTSPTSHETCSMLRQGVRRWRQGWTQRCAESLSPSVSTTRMRNEATPTWYGLNAPFLFD